jgi:hypothetical protein
VVKARHHTKNIRFPRVNLSPVGDLWLNREGNRVFFEAKTASFSCVRNRIKPSQEITPASRCIVNAPRPGTDAVDAIALRLVTADDLGEIEDVRSGPNALLRAARYWGDQADRVIRALAGKLPDGNAARLEDKSWPSSK